MYVCHTLTLLDNGAVNTPVATNRNATIEEKLDALFFAVLIVSNTRYVVKGWQASSKGKVLPVLN
jgi:hypothetical protein